MKISFFVYKLNNLEILIDLIKSFVGATVVLVPAYWLHKREVKKVSGKLKETASELKEVNYKAEVLAKLLDFRVISQIRDAVEDVFLNSRADRFLILIAMNGVKQFKVVSVVFEQYKMKEHNKDAVGMYHHITIDKEYKDLLIEAERFGMVTLQTSKMKPCMLRSFYVHEGVKHSQIRHLFRHRIDNENDLLIYSSMATHQDGIFEPPETDYIQARYDSSIKMAIKKMLLY